MESAADILKLDFVSYHTPLDKARLWTRSGDPQQKEQACLLLEGLHHKYSHALEIGQEWVLALLECGREDEAKRVLERIEPLHRNPNEEILCRWGRLYKDQGDRYVPAIGVADEKQTDDPIMAERYYRLALTRYDAAYKIRNGHYPGINKATLLLIVGTLGPGPFGTQQSKDRQDSAALAQDLLARRRNWPHDLPDDDIWHPATEAEAHLLLQHWEESARLYHIAQAQPNFHPQNQESMRRQVQRILHCFRKIGITNVGPFSDLDAIFPVEGSAKMAGPPGPARA